MNLLKNRHKIIVEEEIYDENMKGRFGEGAKNGKRTLEWKEGERDGEGCRKTNWQKEKREWRMRLKKDVEIDREKCR